MKGWPRGRERCGARMQGDDICGRAKGHRRDRGSTGHRSRWAMHCEALAKLNRRKAGLIR